MVTDMFDTIKQGSGSCPMTKYYELKTSAAKVEDH
jgi:hypothetical protein